MGRLASAVNSQFTRFAAPFGFRLRACGACRSRTKGNVERLVGLVRDNYIFARTILGDRDLAALTFT